MIAERLATVRRNIAEAAKQAGRDPATVRLIAVSKRHPAEVVCEAYDAGQRDFGENSAQEMAAKAAALAATGRHAQWHFIGQLQRNKVNLVLREASVVHTLDREELLGSLVKRGAASTLRVLVQVNIGYEPQKGGIDPAHAVEFARHAAMELGPMQLGPSLDAAAERAGPSSSQRAVNSSGVIGLMAIPPADEDPRPYFRQLADLLRQLQSTPEGKHAAALSMGMSHDYQEAIDCGATLVRVGTAIFGERDYPRREVLP